jgi:hypothetical protein
MRSRRSDEVNAIEISGDAKLFSRIVLRSGDHEREEESLWKLRIAGLGTIGYQKVSHYRTLPEQTVIQAFTPVKAEFAFSRKPHRRKLWKSCGRIS